MKPEIKENECFITKEALGVLGCRAKDEARPVLTGALIKDNRIICADGFVIGVADVVQGEKFPSCIIPSEDIIRAGINKLLGDFGGVVITSESPEKLIISGKYKLLSHPIYGNFPEYEKLFLIPQKVLTDITIDIGLLLKTFKGQKITGNKTVTLRIREQKQSPNGETRLSPVEFCTQKAAGLIMPYNSNPDPLAWGSARFIQKIPPPVSQ